MSFQEEQEQGCQRMFTGGFTYFRSDDIRNLRGFFGKADRRDHGIFRQATMAEAAVIRFPKSLILRMSQFSEDFNWQRMSLFSSSSHVLPDVSKDS